MPDVMSEVYETLNALAASAVTEVAETMAFLCAAPLPAGVPANAPEEPCIRLTMAFTGSLAGQVQIVTPQSLGSMMTANLLCSDTERDDALMELLNMTCGVLFRSASVRFNARFDISLPKLEPFDAASYWQDFCARPGATVLDIEGTSVAICVIVDKPSK